MSNAPYLLPNAREGYRLGNGTIVDSMIHDGLWDAYENFHMGNTGEIVAEKYRVSRERQDEYALDSHRKAVAAIRAGRFRDEIVPVPFLNERAIPCSSTRTNRPAPTPRIEALACAETGLQEGRHRHRRQCSGRERRRCCAGRDLGRTRRAAGQDAAGPHRRPGGQRHRTGAGHDGAGESRAKAARQRSDGTWPTSI